MNLPLHLTGGHYTAYALNHISGQWYEFDDQYVTEVDPHQVEQAEAYVLFYRLENPKVIVYIVCMKSWNNPGKMC